MLPCPTQESLERLLGERLSEPELNRVETHVETCKLCQTTLHRLAHDDRDADLPHLASWLSAAEHSEASLETEAFLQRLQRDVQGEVAEHSSLESRGADERPSVDGYDLYEEIGRGSVGVVYRARHHGLNRWVALKMILAGPFSSPSERQRFRIESQAIARLRHPNIVQVYDVGEQSGRLFLTLELVEGRNLASVLNGAPRQAAEAARLIAVIAEAVEYAHSQGVIHRDLKPANVLLGRARASSAAPHDAAETALSLADSELKVTDFGLAKVSPDAQTPTVGMTRSGDFLGTPSYAAPEQARGHANEVGPAADIYSLGAILYELLTGRPPFQGASVLETLLQVAHHEPVPASRLVPKVPRDLDTICLKCLEKTPEKRFASAGELAADLRRFLADEPIHARPVGRIESTARWVRRRPAQAIAIVGSVLGVMALIGAVLWVSLQRASTERSVKDDLVEFANHERVAEWTEARTSLERAKARLGAAGSAELRGRLDQGDRELELASRLDAIRQQRAILDEGRFDMRFSRERADRDYAAALQGAGLGTLDEDPAIVAARVAASNVRSAIVPALDDWAAFATDITDREKRRWLLDVARLADPDPTGWRDRVRDPEGWMDRAVLTSLTESASAAEPSVQLLVAIGERLVVSGGDGVPFLKRVQHEHPGDFWANFGLANALIRADQNEEALGYFRAALAARPQALAIYFNLALLFRVLNRWDEAIDCCQRILRIDPENARAHDALGMVLEDMGKRDEAIDQFETALARDPQLSSAHTNLFSVFMDKGQIDDAILHARIAVDINPANPRALVNLGYGLQAKGQSKEAIALYEQALSLDSGNALTHSNLAGADLLTGRVKEALAQCEQALRLDPDEPKAHINYGQALQKLGRTDEAVEHFRIAMRLDPKEPRALEGLGRIAAAQGNHPEAIAFYRRALELNDNFGPTHNLLGTELAQWNQMEEALEHFRRAVQLEPWVPEFHANLGTALVQLDHCAEAEPELRRWVELLGEGHPLQARAREQWQRCLDVIAREQRLPAVLNGQEKPADAAEALLFAELCRRKRLYATAVRIASEAFELAPQLAETPQNFERYNAACCAARAGCGQGQDAAGLSADERAQLRQTARGWLISERTALDKLMDSTSAADRDFVKRSMSNWKRDPDLAGVRDDEPLMTLLATEREEWRALWSDVNTLAVRAGVTK